MTDQGSRLPYGAALEAVSPTRANRPSAVATALRSAPITRFCWSLEWRCIVDRRGVSAVA